MRPCGFEKWDTSLSTAILLEADPLFLAPTSEMYIPETVRKSNKTRFATNQDPGLRVWVGVLAFRV